MKTMTTKNDLSEATREKMTTLLNAQLADAIHLMLQAKQAHWNVKGPYFRPLHELFDELHGESVGWVDDLAERAVQLGGVAEGTLAAVTERTRLTGYRLDLVEGRGHVDALSDALANFGASTRKAIDAADTAGDADTADLFTEISRSVDKMLWFLEAHLQG
jgi:starvation-inducible DNA-binding protein